MSLTRPKKTDRIGKPMNDAQRRASKLNFAKFTVRAIRSNMHHIRTGINAQWSRPLTHRELELMNKMIQLASTITSALESLESTHEELSDSFKNQ